MMLSNAVLKLHINAARRKRSHAPTLSLSLYISQQGQDIQDIFTFYLVLLHFISPCLQSLLSSFTLLPFLFCMFQKLQSTIDEMSVEDKAAVNRNKALVDKNREGADIPGKS